MAGNMEKVLRVMADRGASDLFLSEGSPVQFKLHGAVSPMSEQLLSSEQIRRLLAEVLRPEALATFAAASELNTSVHLPDVGGFRLSVFRQRGGMAAVLRLIPKDIPALSQLGVPAFLQDLVMEMRGLVLMVGASGSGKSTTVAAMLEHRNQRVSGHILTVEDPIEFLFTHKMSVVNQREVGRDTQSMGAALRNAMRQAPDVLMIGEIRDRESMDAALSYALSGHLVLATLHANNADHTLGRVLSFYPPEVRGTIMGELAAALRAIISQRLLRATTGGRVAAVEVLRNSKNIADLIEKGDMLALKEAIENSASEGSQTFEADLARLFHEGLVSKDEALRHADSSGNLMWRLHHHTAQAQVASSASEQLGNDRSQEPPEIHAFTIDVRIDPPPASLIFPSLSPR